ncbi:MAG TPA: class I SAM-dependent methyltransferase [Longimicrobiaceae bacterium]|nr:class I SAM-dependent methyltransferase [Longimicrobiaceae bacterium]
MEPAGLYGNPELYSLLRPPAAELLPVVLDLARRHLREPAERVLDPACGPGDWLRLFGERGWALAGSDRSEPMVRAAAERLRPFGPELAVADMRRLCFSRRNFDLAAEVSGAIAELPGSGALAAHLHSVARHLRPGGVYVFLALHAEEGLATPAAGYRSPPVPAPGGGTASLAYEYLRHDPARGRVWVRRTVRLAPPPQRVVDRYVLRLDTPDSIRRAVQRVPGLACVEVLDGLPGEPDPGGVGERLVVVRRR